MALGQCGRSGVLGGPAYDARLAGNQPGGEDSGVAVDATSPQLGEIGVGLVGFYCGSGQSKLEAVQLGQQTCDIVCRLEGQLRPLGLVAARGDPLGGHGALVDILLEQLDDARRLDQAFADQPDRLVEVDQPEPQRRDRTDAIAQSGLDEEQVVELGDFGRQPVALLEEG